MPNRKKHKEPSWLKETKLGNMCDFETHCDQCNPDGSCDSCNTVYGRFMDVVNEYASTCDGCGELAMHEFMTMDPKTQLGYCETCAPKQPKEVRDRYGQSYKDYLPFNPDS